MTWIIDFLADILFYSQNKLAIFIRYIVLFIITIISLLAIAMYKEIGYFSFSLLFNLDVIYYLLYENKKIIFSVLIIEYLMLLFNNYRLYKQIKERKNCGVQTVTLEEISKIWLQKEEYKEILKEEIQKEVEETPKTIQSQQLKVIVPHFHKDRSVKLFDDYIKPYLYKLNEYDIKIIFDLIEELEVNGNIESVVGYAAKKEIETVEYNKIVSNGKTSYDILKNITLYDHSMNVVNEAIKILNEKAPNDKILYIASVIIAALAHDIGKIKKFEQRLKGITLEMFKQISHQQISAQIFRELYPDYPQKEQIVQAIHNHHNEYKKDKDNNLLLEILIRADKEARKKEITAWEINQKNQKEADKEEIAKKENPDKEVKQEVSQNNKKEVEKIDENIEHQKQEEQFNTNIEDYIENEFADLTMEDITELSSDENNKIILDTEDSLNIDNVFEKYEFGTIWENLLNEIHSNELFNIDIKGEQIDYNNFSLPSEDRLIIANKRVKKFLSNFLTSENEENIEIIFKAFVKEAKIRNIVLLVNTSRGFYSTKINIYIKSLNKTFDTKGVFFAARKLFDDKNSFFEKMNNYPELKNIKVSIPKFDKR